MLPFFYADLQRVVADLLSSGHAAQNPDGSTNDPANQVKKCLISTLIYSDIQCTFLISVEIMRDKDRAVERQGERLMDAMRVRAAKEKRKRMKRA